MSDEIPLIKVCKIRALEFAFEGIKCQIFCCGLMKYLNFNFKHGMNLDKKLLILS